MTTVLETSEIPPPHGVAADLMVPLSFMDIFWLSFHPICSLFFYDHSCSEPEFLATIVPNLKHSLSLTLKHYLPVAGNLLYPLETEKLKPIIRYVSGDSVKLTIAVTALDYEELSGNHPRESDLFYDFLPPLPPSTEEEDYKVVPLLALQVTLFPGRGICIGLNLHHCLGDARSIAEFMWAWAEISKSGGDEEFQSRNGKSLPSFDRSVLGDCGETDDRFWNIFKNIPLAPSTSPLPTNRVRASFTLHQSDIKKLKNMVQSKNPDLAHVSSFIVTAAYTWSSVLQSAGEEVDEDNYQVFIFAVDARGRPNALVDPPVPVNFFGNCLAPGIVKLKHKELAGDGGYLAAAEAIANEINNRINDKENFLRSPEEWMSEIASLANYSIFGIFGSPKVDFLDSDFGWGKGKRLEALSMDRESYSMSLCKSWDSAGGLVVGLSLPRDRMKALTAAFHPRLRAVLPSNL